MAGTAFAGADGGIWIGVLTDRASLPLPVLYTTVLPAEQVQAVNTLLVPWADADSLDDPVLRQQLRAASITHLYVGARPSNIKVDELLAAPYLRLVYQQEGVSIFELLLPEPYVVLIQVSGGETRSNGGPEEFLRVSP